MIKNILSSKIIGAASGECFVIGVKLADTEAHAIRLFGFILLLASAAILVNEWHHKANSETTTAVSGKKSGHKTQRARKSSARR